MKIEILKTVSLQEAGGCYKNVSRGKQNER